MPDLCQKEFGRCNSDDIPFGPTTSADDRPQSGSVPWGIPITRCVREGTVALTFDDGPSDSTTEILEILQAANATATFFVTGNNKGKGQIDRTLQWREVIQAIDAGKHQIASHGWSHFNLDELDSEDRKQEMYRNERALANIIGRYPTYMRPPYIQCGVASRCLEDMKDLGYHVIDWTIDSKDDKYPKNPKAMNIAIDGALPKYPDGGIIFVQHDTIPVSAVQTTKHILRKVEENGWRAVTVAGCLGSTLQEAYRSKMPVTEDSSGIVIAT